MGQIRRQSAVVIRVMWFCLLVGWIGARPASAQVLFSMNYSSGAYPAAGWQNPWPESDEWRRAHLPGGGPNGQNAIEMIQLFSNDGGSYGGQHYWGWWGYVEGSDPSPGSRRYYRFRMYFTPDSNMRSRHWQDGSATGSENKLLIVGDTCGSNCRFIFTYDADTTNNRIGNFRLQIDGGANLVDTPPYNFGQWLNIQIELQSTGAGSTGGYKIWINNNNYNSPTAQRSGFQFNPTNWRMVGFGYFSNHGLASNGIHKWRHADFQVATSFDANWNVGGTSPPTVPAPQAPFNVRVVR